MRTLRNALAVVSLALAVAELSPAVSQPASVSFYVSTQGNDQWSGLLADPNAGRTDGPFATFEKARAAVQALDKSGLTEVDVQFRGGTYYLPATEMLTAADSGTASLRIVYENYPGETPVLSGGVRVEGWRPLSGNRWQATVPSTTAYFEDLFVGGVRRLRPRLGGYLGTFYRVAKTVYLSDPKSDPPPPAKPKDPGCQVYIPNQGWECFDRFQYDPADPISASWKNLTPPPNNRCGVRAGGGAPVGDIALLDFEQFSTSKLRIECVDPKQHLVYLTGSTAQPQSNASEVGFIEKHRYLVDNVADALNQPGQWFLDRSHLPWTITYIAATASEDPNFTPVVIPQLPRLLVTSGLSYVTFRGLTFAHDNFTVPQPAGYVARELEPNIDAAVSVQNSSELLFDGITATQTGASGIEIITCNDPRGPAVTNSPPWCVTANQQAVTRNVAVRNSAFFDLGVHGIRVGEQGGPMDTDANVPRGIVLENNVIEGYGRTIPSAFGIGSGVGHDNLFTHNDVYDGYHCAISISQNLPDKVAPANGSHGAFNNTISFNHVWNLLQGIMNDGGSIRVQGGDAVFDAAGTKILNNKIHDVTDASIQDRDGYGGAGIYMDNDTGQVDVENNLVYRVSANAIYAPHGPNFAGQPNIIKNNILAFARQGMISVSGPYAEGVPTSPHQVFSVTNNLMLFDRDGNSAGQSFYVQGGCSYAVRFPRRPFTTFQFFDSNLYWRANGSFAADPQAFHAQHAAGTGKDAPCSLDTSTWTYYDFAAWQASPLLEDIHSVIKNPLFKRPSYPFDNYALPHGSPGVGFVVFDPNAAGRTAPVLKPPVVAAGFPTMRFDPAKDY